LFGLRLLTDFELGDPYPPPLPQPRNLIPPRTLEWCPAGFTVIEATETPQSAGISAASGRPPACVLPRVGPDAAGSTSTAGSQASDAPETDLRYAIRQLAGACMAAHFGRNRIRVMRSMTTIHNTGTSLAYLLAAGFGKRWQLDRTEQSAADAMLALLTVPKPFRLQWRASIACIAAAEGARDEVPTTSPVKSSEEVSHLRAEEPRDDPAEQSSHHVGPTAVQQLQSRPILLKAEMKTAITPQFLWAAGKKWQPHLRLLVGSHRAAHAVALSSSHEALSTALEHSMHFFDALDYTLSDDRKVWSVQFLIPGDHGLDLHCVSAILVDMLHHTDVSMPVPLSDFEACSIPVSRFCQLGKALGLRVPATSGRESVSSGGISLVITSCRETSTTYEVSAELNGATNNSKLSLTTDLAQPTHRCAHADSFLRVGLTLSTRLVFI
jgi:hypothetical protein